MNSNLRLHSVFEMLAQVSAMVESVAGVSDFVTWECAVIRLL